MDNLILEDYKPRWYQLPILDAIVNKGYKRVLACLPRRAGKDITAWNLCIRECLTKVGVYYYIFPTYSQAKKVIWNSITNDGKKFLDFIPREYIAGTNSQDMSIRFKTGSLLQLVGSDNADSLRGTNPRGTVWSEYADQDPEAYSIVRPILAANDGWAVFLSCVGPDTLVMTNNGLSYIKDIITADEGYTDLEHVNIWGLGGFHKATQFFHQKRISCIKITNSYGFEIICSPIHKLWNGEKWIKSKDIRLGMIFPVQIDQACFGPGIDMKELLKSAPLPVNDGIEPVLDESCNDPDFFYFLGILWSHARVLKDNEIRMMPLPYPEMNTIFRRWGFVCSIKIIIGKNHLLIKSRRLSYILKSIFNFSLSPSQRHFPNIIFRANKEQLKAFIQGIFDTCSINENNRIRIFHCNRRCLQVIQTILLSFGILSRFIFNISTRKRIEYLNFLIIEPFFSCLFRENIGFRIEQKRLVRSESSKKKVKNKNLLNLSSDKFYLSKVVKIESCKSDVYDFVIPETHSFFSNGYISHNTPRGKNHFWDLYQVAQNSPYWFAYKYTLDDTKHIPLEEIEKERQEGIMSEDMIQQEYYCSFDMGIEGGVYTKYLHAINLKGQVCNVEYDPSFKVHTFWDIGVADATSIIFAQCVGQQVNVIDYCEKTGVGLDYYIKMLQSKPYIYGKHIAPHDMKQRIWTEGAMTRVEKARQMGINFVIAPDVDVYDGIETVRASFGKLWFDRDKCATLLKAIENYRYEWDSKKGVYKNEPLHNWASHACDSLRYLCISLPKTRDGSSAEDIDRRYRETMGGPQNNLPSFFRNDFNNMR